MSGDDEPPAKQRRTSSPAQDRGELRADRKETALDRRVDAFLDGKPGEVEAPANFLRLAGFLGKGADASDWGKHALLPICESLKDLAKGTEPPAAAVTGAENGGYGRGLAILEPWEDVGENDRKEGVRSSVNLAYVASALGFEDIAVVPLWCMRMGFPTLPHAELRESLHGKHVVCEGGAPDVYDEMTFHRDTASREALWGLYKELLLSRPMFQSQTFVCLSHQLIASTLVELIKDAQFALSVSPSKAMQECAAEIERVGRSITIAKMFKSHEEGGKMQRRVLNDKGWRSDDFATGRKSGMAECGLRELCAFVPSEHGELEFSSPELRMCLAVHSNDQNSHLTTQVAGRKTLHAGKPIEVAMFHGVEVNYEAIVFVDWALKQIREFRGDEDAPSWFDRLPIAVVITSCTKTKEDAVTSEGDAIPAGGVVTDVASMRVDFEGGLSANSCQFHSELLGSLRDLRVENPLDFDSLRQHDGQRVVAHLLSNRCQ